MINKESFKIGNAIAGIKRLVDRAGGRRLSQLTGFRSFVCFYTALAISVGAQIAVAEPMVFVDMQRLIDDSIVGRAAKNDVEAEARKRLSQLLAQQRELEKAKGDLAKQRGVLSPSAFEERSEALVKKQREFERSTQDFQEEITRKSQAAVGKVVKEIQAVVTEFSESHGFGLVLERDARTVLYVRPEFDISEQIINILNEKKLAS